MTQGYGNVDTAPPKAAPPQPDRKIGADDVSGRKDPPSPKEEAAEVNTPGDGALPDPSPDGDADPGVG